LEDKKHGEGKWIFSDKSLIQGHFIQDTLSEGTFKSSSTGNTYKGSFKNFKKHGKGEMTFKDGNVYIGNFEEGRI